MTELDGVLAAFLEATGCHAAVWRQDAESRPLVRVAAGSAEARAPDERRLSEGGALVPVSGPGGDAIAARIPGPRRAWVVAGPCTEGGRPLSSYLNFLLPVVSQYLHSALEVEHAANELAERYEEINLLYTISEILGRAVRLEETAATILTEISETVGARKASILVHDSATNALHVIAALGVAAGAAPAIDVDDQCSVSARVFRTQHPQIVESGEMECEAERLYRNGAMLSVPIMWTAPDGGEPLGVVNLSERRSGQAFTAGDQKLVAAIATQIGTAIQNARLVSASLEQQQLAQEMHLAHDLQMKLLPNAALVAPEAEVAARVVPAASVGGDFYHLFRLGGQRTGVMIGDVSGHGYRAALIMALAMSATAIHAQATNDPAVTIDALLASLGDELDTTEMFITSFYGVVDRIGGSLHYANAGHPHAFLVGGDGQTERLGALDPPLGMMADSPSAGHRPWRSGVDLLVLFTDGLSDSRNRAGSRLGEAPVLDTIVRHRAEPTALILEQVFEMIAAHSGDVAPLDDQTLVIVRS